MPSSLAGGSLYFGPPSWEQALRTINRYLGTSQVYSEGCTRYNCTGGKPVSRDVETATIAVGSSPLGITINPSSNRIYVANSGANSVSVIDGTSNSLILTVTSSQFSSPTGVAVNPATNRVYVTNSGSNTVSVIDATSNAVIGSPIPVGAQPTGVGVNPTADPKTNLVYVANFAGNSVSVINGTSNTLLTTIPISSTLGSQSPNSVAVNFNPTTNRGSVYVTSPFGCSGNCVGSVSVINETSNAVLSIPLPGGSSFTVPAGVAVNPSTNRVYVAAQFSPNLFVINGTSNTVLTSIALDTNTFGVAVNPNNNRVYVVDENPLSLGGPSGAYPPIVFVLDGTPLAPTLLSTVNTIGSGSAFSVTGIAVNPATNLVYVANFGNTVSVIGQRPELREACLLGYKVNIFGPSASTNCLVVSSVGTLFPGTTQSTPVSLTAVSLYSTRTQIGTQMAITVVCDNNTTNATRQCSSFYVDGNVWGPDRQDLTKSPFIIQNAEPYFYLQFHWWDFQNSRIVAWGTWWYGTASNPNWYWGVYWWWRTYVNYYIGIPYIPWWWWSWHWMYWRYWSFWGTIFQT